MRTLVTGGTGILGSHLVEALVAQAYDVRALVRKTSDTGHLETTGAELVYGDVTDYDSLSSSVKGVDIVFHAASRVTPGWGEWKDFESTIVKGTENLLRASAEAGVSRFLHVSSSSVIGALACGDTPADECKPCAVQFTPDTYYDYAKKEAEDRVLDYYRLGRLDVTIIRPGGIYGPRDRLFADRTYRHMSSRIIVWPGECNPRCAPVFASDIAELAILAATSQKAIGQIYNVAPAREVRFREFCAFMIKAQGGPRTEVTIPYKLAQFWCFLMEGWARLRRAKEMPYLTRSGVRFLSEGMNLDGSKARRELGWEEKVSMEEGTRLYVQWRRSCEAK
jgi:nucleoside-diphosphate-sugar epimerase